jgi:hypothetical protein
MMTTYKGKKSLSPCRWPKNLTGVCKLSVKKNGGKNIINMLENEGRSSPSIIQTQLIVRGVAIAERKCEINVGILCFESEVFNFLFSNFSFK